MNGDLLPLVAIVGATAHLYHPSDVELASDASVKVSVLVDSGPKRYRSPAERERRQEAARAKRFMRRHVRLNRAFRAAEGAVVAVALLPALASLRDERHPETLLYDLAVEIVEDLIRGGGTAASIRRDPVAAVRAWGAP